ncbi:MAG: hypothetical protein HPY74_03605 [Firmicutes bacterium]|nr:hypothetical protein [Bacillota bacterium]
MYNFSNKQYVFKQFSGKIWNFSHDVKLGICYSNLTKRNTWTEPISIEKKAYQHFYAAMDDERFHLIYQDLHGNIIYSKFDEMSIMTLPILNSKSPSLYNKHFYLIPANDNIHFLYILLYNNNVLLTHQMLINGTVGSPKVIDYVYNNNLPYSAIRDKSGNIYVFYQSTDTTNMQLGYRLFSEEQDIWSKFIPVTGPGINCDFPSAIVDNSNIIHICFQKRSPRYYELVYKQKIPDKSIWSDETVIHSSVYPFENSSILCLDEKVIIYWVRNDIIYYCFSNNKGNSWSKPAKYNFPAGRQLLCISYNTNIPYELSRIAIRDIPGSFANGLKLAFYQDFLGNNNVSSTQESLKNMIVDSFKYLKEGIDNLTEGNKTLKNQIRELELIQKNLIREKERYSIKLNLLENELKQLKQITGKPEKFKEYIRQHASEKHHSSYTEIVDNKNNNSNNDECKIKKTMRLKKFEKIKRFRKK